MRSLTLLAIATVMPIAPFVGETAAAQSLANVPIGAVKIYGFVAEAAQRFGLPEAWLRAVIRAESGGDPHAVSRVGAMGLMQLMPATWAAMRARHGLGTDPFDPHDNIVAGAAYLRLLHDRYGNPAAMLAAYNAGPGRYDDWLARRRPLPVETVGYLTQLHGVTGETTVATVTPDSLAWTRAPLFTSAGTSASSAIPAHVIDGATAASSHIAAAADAPPETLFVARQVAGSAR